MREETAMEMGMVWICTPYLRCLVISLHLLRGDEINVERSEIWASRDEHSFVGSQSLKILVRPNLLIYKALVR